MSDTTPILDVHLREYDRLKAEQIARIGFRDNLIYSTLAAYGVILSLATASSTNVYALLVLPWASLILGWTYLTNDHRISAIGRYLRLTLTERVRKLCGAAEDEPVLAWETAHRSDPRRYLRKWMQLVIDEVTFVCSGVAALVAFRLLMPDTYTGVEVLFWIEAVMLAILGVEIFVYAELTVGK